MASTGGGATMRSTAGATQRPGATAGGAVVSSLGFKIKMCSEEETANMVQMYESILSQREAESIHVQSQLEVEQRRSAMLESELSLALAAASRAEAAHGSELAKVEGDVARVLSERRGLLEKLQSIEVVEDAVREMVVQMKVRIGDDGPPPPEQLQAEKDALRGENILTVLGSLRATMKSLFDFKVEAEEDLRASRGGRHQQHAQQVLSLKSHIRDMEAQVRRAQQAEQEARRLAAEETSAREAVLAESEEVLAQMEVQHRELLASLKSATDEAVTVRKALAAALEEGRKRDGLVLKNQQLESARHFDRVAQDRELRQMQSEHNRQITAMQTELGRIGDLIVQNDALRDQLGKALRGQEQMRAKLQSASAQEELADRRLRTQDRDKPAKPSVAGSNESKRPQPTRPGSSAAAELLANMRATAKEQAKAAAEEQEEHDPIYATLANVNKMYRGTKAKIKDVKREIAGSGPSW